MLTNDIPIKTPPAFASFLALLGIFILVNLGLWQLERLEWKQDLITKIEAAYANDNPPEIILEEKTPEFTYGHITGTFMPDKAFLLGPPIIKDETVGYRLIVPIKTQGQTLPVNMGWTPQSLEAQNIRHLQGKPIRFTGLLRFFSWNSFTPQNKPEENIWYRLDIPLIAASKKLDNPYPAILLAESSDQTFDPVFFSEESRQSLRERPNNNHFQYACFWFAMAGALLVIFILRFMIVRKPH